MGKTRVEENREEVPVRVVVADDTSVLREEEEGARGIDGWSFEVVISQLLVLASEHFVLREVLTVNHLA